MNTTSKTMAKSIESFRRKGVGDSEIAPPSVFHRHAFTTDRFGPPL
jgi:hypothetical protein